MPDIRCGNCGSPRTNWGADAVGCEVCGAATYADGTLAHGPTVDLEVVAEQVEAAEEAASHMTTTETVEADESEQAADLDDLTVAELREQAAEQDIKGRSGMNKEDLIEALGG
jgi:uncharacterized Zn finger protein (UPF0148 family)